MRPGRRHGSFGNHGDSVRLIVLQCPHPGPHCLPITPEGSSLLSAVFPHCAFLTAYKLHLCGGKARSTMHWSLCSGPSNHVPLHPWPPQSQALSQFIPFSLYTSPGLLPPHLYPWKLRAFSPHQLCTITPLNSLESNLGQ